MIENRRDYENVNNDNDENAGGVRVPESQEILFDRAGLINSIPANQRQAVSAILRQRQAQRIRSKSMVHQNLNLEREGKNVNLLYVFLLFRTFYLLEFKKS